jgi:glycosyltransferase involved in cell wall biosynthesis
MKILGVMRIKNEERWIRDSIESQLSLCEKMIVFDDHSTDATRDIVRSFGERCVLVDSPFEGIDEARDKRHILTEHILPACPDWVLWIDGDEVLERRAAEIFRSEMRDDVAWLAPRVVYFWDQVDTFRSDGCYGNFRRGSLFRLRGQQANVLQFTGTGTVGFHCGNVPQGLAGAGLISNVRIKHFGYLDAEQRRRKFAWYNEIDPNNESEDFYRHMIEIPGARHAPGPTVLQTWSE